MLSFLSIYVTKKETMNIKLKEKFISLYGHEPQLFRSPGRVNLIGEHTDYNEGFVLPAAIDKEVVFAIQKNNTSISRFYALDLEESYELDLNTLEKAPQGSWANYLIGVTAQFLDKNQKVEGYDCVFCSSVPLGAGLSSSAALECCLAFGLNKLFELENEPFELVKMAQKAEHEFAGVKCGVMDQFASVFGKEGHLVRLDCKTEEYQYVPFELPNYRIVLINTMVKHSLASSEYNTRREECERGVSILKKYYPDINSLRDVTNEMLEKHQAEFSDNVYKRCTYVVNENTRVIEGCKDLNNNDVFAFGEKMYATHHGLSENYKVSCTELDFLVEHSKPFTTVVGSRMMGGGFGGCTINLVKEEGVDDFVKSASEAYQKQFNVVPEVYIAQIANGSSYVLPSLVNN